MPRILFDSFKPSHAPIDGNSELPERISNQWLQLPENIRENTRVTYREGLVLLSLPVPPTKGKVFVAYNGKPPHRVEAVYFSQNGATDTPIELTKEALCLGPYTGLARIYERVLYLVGGEAWPSDHRV